MAEDDKPVIIDQLRTPLQIIQRMEWVLFYIRRGTEVVAKAREEYLKVKTDYLIACKEHAQDDPLGGTKTDREDRAAIHHKELWRKMDTAEAAFRYAQDKKSNLDGELSKLQTESRLVIKEMELAGKGSI